jgi:hypothetical protein
LKEQIIIHFSWGQSSPPFDDLLQHVGQRGHQFLQLVAAIHRQVQQLDNVPNKDQHLFKVVLDMPNCSLMFFRGTLAFHSASTSAFLLPLMKSFLLIGLTACMEERGLPECKK